MDMKDRGEDGYEGEDREGGREDREEVDVKVGIGEGVERRTGENGYEGQGRGVERVERRMGGIEEQ